MKIFFAGISGHVILLSHLEKWSKKRLMLTFYERSYYRHMDKYHQLGFELMMDSGAFSAWKQNISIDIDEYCNYLRQHSIHNYIVLDVIGDPIKSKDNLAYMVGNGFKPIPVYHYGSDIQYLKNLIDSGYNYICLGGTVGLGFPKRCEFFKKVFDFNSEVMYHGLGVSDFRLLKIFPFYSVDSTTWLIAGKCGLEFDSNGKRRKPVGDTTKESRFKNTISFISTFDTKPSLK